MQITSGASPVDDGGGVVLSRVEESMEVGDHARLVHAARLARHSPPVLVHGRFGARARRGDLLVVVTGEVKPEDHDRLIADSLQKFSQLN